MRQPRLRRASIAGRLPWVAGLLLLAAPLAAEVGSDGPVRPSGGSLRDLSGTTSTGSRPVHESGRSVRSSSAGPLSGSSVRGSTSGTLSSGSVRDITVGAVTEDPPRLPPIPFGAIPSADADTDEPALAAPADSLHGLAQELRAVEPLPSDPEPSADADAEVSDDDSEHTDAENHDNDTGDTTDAAGAPADEHGEDAPTEASGSTDAANPAPTSAPPPQQP